jgi:hypothetical protein
MVLMLTPSIVPPIHSATGGQSPLTSHHERASGRAAQNRRSDTLDLQSPISSKTHPTGTSIRPGQAKMSLKPSI